MQQLSNPKKDTPEKLVEHEKTAKSILEAYQGLAKGKIISLQQETHFHAHLIGRMVNKAASHEDSAIRAEREKVFGNTDVQFQKGVEKALLSLNDEVLKLQARALEKAYKDTPKNKDGVVNQQAFAIALNEQLDKARKDLLPMIAKKVSEEVIKSTGIKFTPDIIQHLSKHLAEATSGSSNDFVHIDKGTGFISFIGANEKTSHHQEFGGSFLADRMMYSHHLSANEEVAALSQRQQVRVPSIAVKKLQSMTKELFAQEKDNLIVAKADDLVRAQIRKLDKHHELSEDEQEQILAEYQKINMILLNTHGHEPYTDKRVKAAINQAIINDTKDKISYLQDKYKLGGETRQSEGPQAGLPQAFVYNLYTTLNQGISGAIDERSNKQTQSAEHILEAAHKYNRENRATEVNPGKPLCLVQNIAVNGWGYELSLNKKNPAVVNEAALMVQMASLHTIYDSIQKPEDKVAVEALFKNYDDFLKTDKSSFYDYLKTTRPEALPALEKLKKDIVISPPVDSTQIAGVEAHRAAFTDNSKKALASLFKEGAFGHHDNGFTYQALSVFTEKSSIGGCKSANERAQAVNGRVSILDFVSLDKTTRDGLLNDFLSTDEAQRLREAADNLENNIILGNTAGINNHLNDLYESLNLEGFQAVISFIDQGGHAKLGTKAGVIPNTNNSETVQTHVDNASKWQCHKGLTKNVLKEFGVHEEVSLGKEFGKTAKKMGLAAVGSAIAGGSALGIAGIALAAGASFAFPPVGIAIAIAAAAVTVAASLVALGSFIHKAWKSHKAHAPFEKAQESNDKLVHEGQAQIEQAKREMEHPEPLVDFAPREVQELDPRDDKVVVQDWRKRSSVSVEERVEVSNPLSKEALKEARGQTPSPDIEPVLDNSDEEHLDVHSVPQFLKLIDQ